MGCGLAGTQGTILWAEARTPAGRGTLGSHYLVIPRRARGRCYQRYSLGAAAMLLSTTIRLLLLLLLSFFDPGTLFPGNEKITLCNKKYKNQAGMNLTPPPPSQNSHAVRWHCTAKSERRVAEIKS